MEMIEGQYSKDPTVGYRKMTEILRKKTGKPINKKRIRRLMRKLGLKGIFPRRKLTKSVDVKTENELVGREVMKPNQV